MSKSSWTPYVNEASNAPGGLKIWPANYLSPEDQEKKRKKKRAAVVVRDFEREKEESALKWAAFQERVEHFVFILIFIMVWCYLVARSLKWLRFPVHRHPIEVGAIYVGPIIVCTLVLCLIDSLNRRSRERETKKDE
jgi:uncharacterized membrane protein (DUF485 family)